MSGSKNDNIYRANIERILLDNIEEVSVQEAVKNALKFTVSYENKHPRDKC